MRAAAGPLERSAFDRHLFRRSGDRTAIDRPTALLLTVGIVVVSGCTAPIGGQPIEGTTVTVGDATAAPGGTTTVTVEATNVAWMSFDLPGEMASPPIRVDFENATVSRSPDTVFTAYPPSWMWTDDATRVVVELPVHVSGRTDPGAYRLAITVRAAGADGTEEGITGIGIVAVERSDDDRP